MNTDTVAYAKVRLEEMLAFLGVNATIQVEEVEGGVEFNIEAVDTGRLIGHRGETLRSIQYLINMMAKNQGGERVYFSVDVAGYKKGRAETIAAKAKARAEKAVETGEDQVTPPMSAAERRIVHMALSDMPQVFTESIGEEPRRRVVIKKREGNEDQGEDQS